MITPAILACALHVAPATMERVIAGESGGNPLAIHVNHWDGPQPEAATTADAAATVRSYIGRGYTVDIGIAQINNRNLGRLGYTVEDALDPCTNVRGAAAILSADYARAVAQYGEGQRALCAALSAYNTGDFWRGVANGYVARIAGSPMACGGATPVAVPNPYTAPMLVYSREVLNVRIN